MNSFKKEHKDSIAVEFYKIFREIFKITRPNILLLITSSSCIVIASFVQALGLGFVVPVLNGLIDKSHFLGILNIPILGNLIKGLPFLHSNINIFLFMMFLIAMAVYIENIAVFISRVLAAKVSTGVEHIFRVKIFDRYVNFAKVFYDKQKIGELNTILTYTPMNAGSFVLYLNMFLITSCFTIVFLLIMLIISWRLTLISFVLLWISQKINSWVSKKISQSSIGDFQERTKLGTRSWEVLLNILLVKLSSNEQGELKEFIGISKELKRHRFNVIKKQESIPVIIDILNSTGLIIIVCITVFLFFWRKEYSLGRSLIYFVILRRFTVNVKQLSDIWVKLIDCVAFIKKGLWVLDDSDKVYIKNGWIPFNSVKHSIVFKNVCFRYVADIPVLKNITLEAKKGQMLAIVGPTGAGKTTIVNLLPRLYEYESGSIEIDGTNIRDFDLETLRKRIGVVAQDIMIFNDTIKNNITYGIEEREVASEKLDEALRNAHIYDFIMGLPDKYNTLLGDRGIRLSQGERQRVSIARALLKNPDILILDEATSALDTQTEMFIQQAIQSLIKNRTTFVIAHRLSTIKNADWVIVVENGEIKEQGTLQELIARKDRFYYYWELQKLFY